MAELAPIEMQQLGLEMLFSHMKFWNLFEEYEELKKKSKGLTSEVLVKQRAVATARSEFLSKLKVFVENANKTPKVT